ncbi:MAG: hypothetical protein M1815_000119 [Lichina confinis]|nr:MAG: hypothetical protein M1815_000119 [Lichina confinis]
MPGVIPPSLTLGRSSSSRGPWTAVESHSGMNMIRRGSAEREHNFLSFGKSPLSNRPAVAAPCPVDLEIVIESPPLVLYGPPATSTGALLSGQLIVTVNERGLRMDGISVVLQAFSTTKKPVHKDCPDCATTLSDLLRIELLKEPTTLKEGRHPFPFSYLLPGHLPATSACKLAAIGYRLSASANVADRPRLRLERPLSVQRALAPGNDRSSTRIFPPTKLSAHVILPSVIYPIGEFPVRLRLDGIVARGRETQTRWRLRKVKWRIDQHVKTISPACAKHAHKVSGDGKGVLHQDTRIIGQREIRSGWKTDYGGNGRPADGHANADVAVDGQIEMEFQAAINPDANQVCDVESAAGTAVTHNFVLELLVSEDFCPNKNTKLITPTGAARMLRLIFKVMVTAHRGLGISWDQEQPPMYSDVPPSPPHYTQIEDYLGNLEF